MDREQVTRKHWDILTAKFIRLKEIDSNANTTKISAAEPVT